MNRRTSRSFRIPTTIPLSALAAATVVAVVVALMSALMMDDAQAQVATSTPPVATSAAGSPFLGMMQGLVGLVIVLGVIFAAGWLLKKIGPRARSTGVVQVVGGASVGPREKVVVVKFGGQTLLLGVASGQVSLLHTAEAADVVDDAVATTPAPRFVDRLRAARSGS